MSRLGDDSRMKEKASESDHGSDNPPTSMNCTGSRAHPPNVEQKTWGQQMCFLKD